MKKVLALLLTMIITVSLCACGNNASKNDATKEPAAATKAPTATETADANSNKSGEKFKIGFSQCVMNHPFRIAMVDSFKEACAQYDDIEPVIVEGNGDVQTEITNIESLIQQGCDAIIVSSLSGTAIYPAYQEVSEAGIPLIIAASGCAQEDEAAYNYYQSFVSTDEVEMGVAAAKYANEILNGKGNVVMIRGVVESTNSMNRYVGWNSEIGNYPDIKVIAEQAADWLRLTANEVMANVLQANSDIDLVYCENDEMALGCLEAIKDAGRQDDIMIISMDGQQDAAEEVEKGESFKLTITNNSDTAEAVKAAYTLANGGTVDKRIKLSYEMVTKDNAADYIAANFK